MILEDINGRLVYPAQIQDIQVVESCYAPRWAKEMKPINATHAIVVSGVIPRDDYDGQDRPYRSIDDTESVLAWYDSKESADKALSSFLSQFVIKRLVWGGIGEDGT